MRIHEFTFNRGRIFRAMDPLSELRFLGRFSSMVRIPYRLLKMTSSGSSSGSSLGISGAVDICSYSQNC